MTKRFILSGGIGSGKSSAAAVFAELGADVIEADAIGHAVLEPGGPAFDAVVELWPEVLEGGRIERRSLGRIVFADREALVRLESITHPAIQARILEVVAASPAQVAMVELPIPSDMLGSGWPRVIVDAPDDVRRRRLRDRGMDDDEIDARMAAQPSRKTWLSLADIVIDNSGDLTDLRREVERAWQEMLDGGRPTSAPGRGAAVE
jgi:dephospho-CoA kinase